MGFFSAICSAAVISAIFRMVVPENKLKKQLSVLIAALFLLVGINAVGSADFGFEELSPDFENYIDSTGISGEVNRELQKKICGDMSDKLYKLLNSQGIYPEEIHVIVNISGLYSISITQVKLVLSSQSEADRAMELAAAELPEEIKLEAVVKGG